MQYMNIFQVAQAHQECKNLAFYDMETGDGKQLPTVPGAAFEKIFHMDSTGNFVETTIEYRDVLAKVQSGQYLFPMIESFDPDVMKSMSREQREETIDYIMTRLNAGKTMLFVAGEARDVVYCLMKDPSDPELVIAYWYSDTYTEMTQVGYPTRVVPEYIRRGMWIFDVIGR